MRRTDNLFLRRGTVNKHTEYTVTTSGPEHWSYVWYLGRRRLTRQQREDAAQKRKTVRSEAAGFETKKLLGSREKRRVVSDNCSSRPAIECATATHPPYENKAQIGAL